MRARETMRRDGTVSGEPPHGHVERDAGHREE